MTILQYRVDTQLARLLSEGYRSSEAALKELVDNAWDADAETVRISLPAPMTQGPIMLGWGFGARRVSIRGRGSGAGGEDACGIGRQGQTDIRSQVIRLVKPSSRVSASRQTRG